MTSFPASAHQQALAAARRGDYATAAGMCQRILAQDGKNVPALALLAHLHHAMGRDDEAGELLRKCVKLEPRNASVRVDLGEVYAAQARYADALRHLDAALKADPKRDDAIMLKAMVLEREGRHDRAREVLAPAVRGPETPPGIAAVLMRLLIRGGRAAEAIALGRAVAGVPRPATLQLRDVHFALARAHETLGDVEAAMAAAAVANAMLEPPFDEAQYAAWVDALIDTFSAERLAALPHPAAPSDLPVFIVGMPRTGSTLTERIIHAHPEAFGAGEITTLPAIAAGLQVRLGAATGYPRCAAALDAGTVEAAANEYLDDLRRRAPRSARRVVDKYLANFEHLGLVNVLFPEARVIDCRRDPVNTCLSCYLERLTPDSAPYATRLERLGAAYRQYERLMEHWRSVLTVPVLEVRYEALIADQPGETRRILEFCGLPWDDRCLRFHEAKRHDNTLSFEQVRKPLYRDSVDRAAKFGPLLDPLRAALGR